MLSADLKQKIIKAQRNEITDRFVYVRLKSLVRDNRHAEILEKIAQEESAHYDFLKGITQHDVSPNRFKIFAYVFISRIFGLNFGLRLMEKGEDLAIDTYQRLREISPEIDRILGDEKTHENALIDLIEEEHLKYVSSIILGLNDALVELSGALVGFTLALQNTRLVGIVGIITGIAASMSMAASEYLSTKQEEVARDPFRASIYTGLAYVGVVLLLVSPYFIFGNIYLCLSLVIIDAVLVVLIFTFYISVAKGLEFKKRFSEMTAISISIAVINFVIGLIIRKAFGIEV
jgi:VIT1/CCC1 family predicted Fe2+/Mn2+ transporter